MPLRFLPVLAVSFLLASPTAAQTTLLAGAHWDVAREAPIASVVYQKPTRHAFVNGFLEVWRNNETGFPADEWSVLSKHWISRGLTNRLSVSMEVEFIYNRAGVAFTYPKPIDFRPGEPRLHVTPKIGMMYRIL